MGKYVPTTLQSHCANIYDDDGFDNDTISLRDLQGIFFIFSGMGLE